MAKISKKEAMASIEQAAVVVIGGPIVLAIPVLGGLLAKLPSFAIGPTSVALPSIVAGAVGVLAYNLIRARLK